jgi:hypothetical protein
MEIRLIIGQYTQRYPGEYMPNVMAAWDEYAYDENWDGYEADVKKYQALVDKGELEAIREMVIRVPDETVLGLFETPEVEAEVVDE